MSARPARARLWTDLGILGVIGLLMIAAFGAGGMALYQQFYSPGAFVERYLGMLSDGRAADALRLPGVAVDQAALDAAGISSTPSEALLRRAALAPLTEIEIVSEETRGDITTVVVSYRAGAHAGTSTFRVVQEGWAGVVPSWRFATSPLAVVDLSVLGADLFAVNGFELDRRQVSAAGIDADPLEPLPMLVFTPGLYSVTVDTATTRAPGVSILADLPMHSTPVDVQAEPTDAMLEVVQTNVESFLSSCAEQRVLLPTACPFGLEVTNRIVDPPVWSIVQHPSVSLSPDGAGWRIDPGDAVAHIEVDIRSIYDGRVQHVSEDVPFQVSGTVSLLADGSVSIRVGSADGS